MARTFALIAPVDPILHRVSCSYETLTNAPKTLYNAPKHEFRVQWGGLGAFVAKNPDVTSRHPVFNRVSCSYETIPNAPKHYAMGENMSLGPMEWIGCVRCEKS